MKYLLIALLSLAACKSRPHHYEVKLQDGTPGYQLDCDKTQFTEQDCLDEAIRLCGIHVEITGGSNNGSYTIVRCTKQ